MACGTGGIRKLEAAAIINFDMNMFNALDFASSALKYLPEVISHESIRPTQPPFPSQLHPERTPLYAAHAHQH